MSQNINTFLDGIFPLSTVAMKSFQAMMFYDNKWSVFI